jgi:hypothetical protein
MGEGRGEGLWVGGGPRYKDFDGALMCMQRLLDRIVRALYAGMPKEVRE